VRPFIAVYSADNVTLVYEAPLQIADIGSIINLFICAVMATSTRFCRCNDLGVTITRGSAAVLRLARCAVCTELMMCTTGLVHSRCVDCCFCAANVMLICQNVAVITKCDTEQNSRCNGNRLE